MNRDDLVLRHDATIRKVLRSRTADPHRAADFLQDTFLKLVRFQRQTDQVAGEGLAVTVASQLYASWRRKDHRELELHCGADHCARDADPALAAELKEQAEIVASFIEALSPLDRDIVKLRIVEGWDHSRIAREINRSTNAVKKRFSRAMKALKQRAQQHCCN